MPVYNQERFVRAAVESILGQTFGDFEFIIVDDGSTDRTAEILRDIDDRRLRIVAKKHEGFVHALERGVREATGRWIARMDSDDVSPPDRLRRQLDFLDAHPECVFVGSVYGVITPRDRFAVPAEAFAWRYLDAKDFTLGTKGMADPSVLFHRALAIEVGLYDRDLNSEIPLWYKLLGRGRGAVLGQPLHFIRWRLGSLSRSLPEYYARVYRDVRERYDPENARSITLDTLAEDAATLSAARRCVEYYLQANDPLSAVEVAAGVWWRSPGDIKALKLLKHALLRGRPLRFWKHVERSVKYLPDDTHH